MAERISGGGKFGDDCFHEFFGGGAEGGELRFQLVHQGHQLFHFGHDPALFGEGGRGNGSGRILRSEMFAMFVVWLELARNAACIRGLRKT
jgi:hypothetical protein